MTLVGSYLLLKRGITGIMQMNSVVVPLMLTLSLIIIFNTLEHPEAHRFMSLVTERSAIAAWLSPFLYTAFNLGMAQAVLVPMARHTKNDRTLAFGGIIGGLGIGFMLMAAHFAMSAHMPGILQFEIPMGSIAFRLGTLVQLVYLLLIFLEIFSTFVADIYGVTLQLAQRLPISHSVITALVMLTCYVFSQFGFSSLLGLFYPMFGALSLVWAVRLILTPMVPPGKAIAFTKSTTIPPQIGSTVYTEITEASGTSLAAASATCLWQVSITTWREDDRLPSRESAACRRLSSKLTNRSSNSKGSGS